MQLNVFLNINIILCSYYPTNINSLFIRPLYIFIYLFYKAVTQYWNLYPASHLPFSVSSIQDIFRFDLYHNNLSGFVSSLTDVGF